MSQSERVTHSVQTASLADILERVRDKGIVIAGDIKISLADIELLNIKIRLLIASVDKAKEMGIDWWQNDPALSSRAGALQQENQMLLERLERLERVLGGGGGLRGSRGRVLGFVGHGRTLRTALLHVNRKLLRCNKVEEK